VLTNRVNRECFIDSQAISSAQKQAFEAFLNVEGRKDRSAQLLALQIDHNMSTESFDAEEDETVISLYRLMHATDTFD